MVESKEVPDHKSADQVSVRDGSVVEQNLPRTGETQDDLDLLELTGHKPVLERNYSRFALLALSFVIVDSWCGIIGALATGINSGGTVGFSKL
jgi:choline transport protein